MIEWLPVEKKNAFMYPWCKYNIYH